jgi:DNA-binding MarR family transcriptional regulator
MDAMATAAQPPSDLGILVLLGYQGFVRSLHDDMRGHGFDDLGSSDGVVFRILSGRPRTVSELASLLGITKQGMAQIVEDLEARGYVARTPDPADRRAKQVELSDRGRAAIAAARRFHRTFEAGLARHHGKEAIRSFRAVLEGMAASAPDGLDRELRSLYL